MTLTMADNLSKITNYYKGRSSISEAALRLGNHSHWYFYRGIFNLKLMATTYSANNP